MGMDIHMSIVKDNKIVAEDIFDGRNSEWFRNMQGEGNDIEYEYLPLCFGVSPQAPEVLKNEYNEEYMFKQIYISVEKFKDWFSKYKPHLEAGWVRVYDKWAWDNKGIRFEEVRYTIPEGENPCEWCFVEYEKEYDCSHWLYDFLIENKVPDDADITYCFDW